MISLLALLAGFLLDLLIGDPHFLYHPVRLVGALISFLEKVIRKIFPKTEKGELAGGTLMAVLVMAVTTAVPALLLYFAGLWCVQARFVVEMILCYWLLATKSLKDESMKVYDKLAAGDLEGSRYAVSMIVGRDTAVLDEKGVTKAAVETVAENTSDGIIAPMLFMAIGRGCFRLVLQIHQYHGLHGGLQERQVPVFWPFCGEAGRCGEFHPGPAFRHSHGAGLRFYRP